MVVVAALLAGAGVLGARAAALTLFIRAVSECATHATLAPPATARPAPLPPSLLFDGNPVDTREITRRAMAGHWSRITVAQQEEMVALMGRLMARWLASEKWDDAEVLVKLEKAPGGWVVRDLVVDEVGLVRIYKAQFDRHMREHGIDALLEKMRKSAG
jgi:hypothetical protein